jgi:hypothetical protein
MLLPIQKSAAKNSVAADSKIGSQVCAAANPEIDSQVLCRCQEIGIKNYAAANPEIDSDGEVVLA